VEPIATRLVARDLPSSLRDWLASNLDMLDLLGTSSGARVERRTFASHRRDTWVCSKFVRTVRTAIITISDCGFRWRQPNAAIRRPSSGARTHAQPIGPFEIRSNG
jgi:hypothetical protein